MFRAKGSPSLVTVIKNDDHVFSDFDGHTSQAPLVWKFLEEDFNTKAQLIVNANEEAVFYRDGVAVGLFTGGRYSLTTQNYPFLTALTKKFTGGVSAFNAKVYFVNKAHKLEMKWGTDSPIEVRDPKWGIQTSVRPRGSYSIQIIHSQKFVEKLIANNVQVFTQEELNTEFHHALSQDIRVAISRHIKELPPGYELMDLSDDLDAIAAAMKPKLSEKLLDYGVEVINFYVGAIDLPTKDQDADRSKISDTLSDKSVFGILGDDWSRRQSANILSDLANNPGTGGVTGVIAGAGLGMGAGNAFGDMANQMFQPQANGGSGPEALAGTQPEAAPSDVRNESDVQQGVTCACGHLNSTGSKFCAECGTALVTTTTCEGCRAEIPSSAKFCPGVWSRSNPIEMSTKPDRYGLAIVVLPPVVVTVILLIVALPTTAVGWISLLLLNVAFLAFLGAFRLSSNEAGRVFGLALRYIAWGYLLIALAATFLILGIPSFQHWLNNRIGLYLLLTLFVTAVYGAFYIGAYLTQRHAGAELAYQRDNLAFGKVAAARLDRIKGMSTDPEFVVRVRGVDDAIRFSLVEWTPAARELEGQIIDELGDVQMCLEGGDSQTAVQKLADIRRLADQRNDAIRLAQ